MALALFEDESDNLATTGFFTFICNIFIILLETWTDILKIMTCFIVQVALGLFNAIAFGFGKLFLNTLYWAAWILFHFTCGILGLEDRSTGAFSWLFLLIILFLYCDGSHHEWFIKFSRFFSTCLKRCHRHMGCQNQNFVYNEIVLENQRNEHREIEPITRQLEAENRENENEENNLVEADRHRVDNDNRRNIERENGAASQRASIENRQNVERERHNTRTTLENRRNRTQEQHRYFLRQRNRNRYLQQDRLEVAQHGIGAVALSGQQVVNLIQSNIAVLPPATRHTRSSADATNPNRLSQGEMNPPSASLNNSYDSAIFHGRTRQGVPHREGGSISRPAQLS